VPLKPYTVNYQELNIPDTVVVVAVNKNKSGLIFLIKRLESQVQWNLKVFGRLSLIMQKFTS
jgi:hypothetical protein